MSSTTNQVQFKTLHAAFDCTIAQNNLLKKGPIIYPWIQH